MGTYYDVGIISVDRDFARFGEKSYAINKINTVEISDQPYRWGAKGCGLGLLLAIGLLLLLIGLAGAYLLSVVGAVICAYAIWLIYMAPRREYQLLLRTSNSDALAYSSLDFEEVRELRDAIEAAMVGRGSDAR